MVQIQVWLAAVKEARVEAYRVMFNSNSLFASLIWGSIGVGFLIYGKKQRLAVPFLGGLALIAVSYCFMDSALYMSLAGVLLVVATIWLGKRG